MMIPIDRPEEMSHLPDRCEFFLLKRSKDIAYMALDIVSSDAGIHLHMINWSHSVYKELKLEWEEIKDFLRMREVSRVIATNSDLDDWRWPKFIKMFGFPKPAMLKISKLEI